MSAMKTLIVPAILVTFSYAMSRADDYENDRVIVRFSHTAALGDVDSLLENPQVIGEASLTDSATVLVRLPAQLSVEQALKQFSQLPIVEYAGPNYYCYFVENQQLSQAFLDANSEPFTAGLTPDDFFNQYAVTKTRMAEAQTLANGSGVLIALIDNGVDFTHPLIASRLSGDGYDFISDDLDPSYSSGEYSGHGTFSAGMLSLSAPGALILPLRALNGDGYGTTFTVVLAIDYALSVGAQVISMGFGMRFDDPILGSAIQRVESKMVLAVAAAGNDGVSAPQYPAAYPSVVATAAVDSGDFKSDFSNFGSWVDVTAPGQEIYSALPGGDYWGSWDGTSFATPIVAGLCAMLRQAHPALPVGRLRDLLLWGADSIDAINPDYDGQLGSGRVNFAGSVGSEEVLSVFYGLVTNDSGLGIPAAALSLIAEGQSVPSAEFNANAVGAFLTAIVPGAYTLSVSSPDPCAFASLPATSLMLTGDTATTLVLNQPGPYPCGLPGDLNGDSVVDVVDVTQIMDVAFRGESTPVSRANCSIPPGDSNCDRSHDIIDVVAVINIAFRGADPTTQFCSPCP